jgi:hypothetical protein
MKGISKILEVLIAILFIASVYLYLFGPGEKVPDLEITTWKIRGFEALRVLDESNKLATNALANETGKIEADLEKILPIGINYKVLICTQECPGVNISSEKITSVSYFIAGNATNLEPKEILLYMWR